ncbi:MAG: hypothetical protein PF542_04415 [Nanoarchaeota archaeon]|nr:hypothetical protein [Nanoarchaeota archaeon]
MKGFNIHSSLDMVAVQKGREKEMEKFNEWLYEHGELYDSVDDLIDNIE